MPETIQVEQKFPGLVTMDVGGSAWLMRILQRVAALRTGQHFTTDKGLSSEPSLCVV